MDDDNLRRAFKGVRDVIADLIGIDDAACKRRRCSSGRSSKRKAA